MGVINMTWDINSERYIHYGIDRGVLYLSSEPKPIPWNGITGFEENGGSTSSVYYLDGIIYLADAVPNDFTAKLTAFSWPDKFSQALGIPEASDGFYVDNQKPKPFGFSYRSLVGSGVEGDMFGYQIHLVYNAVATFGTRSRKTLNDSPEPTDFSFDIVATPVSLPGFRPSAHYIIDTRHLDAATVNKLEIMLYGDKTAGTPGGLPTPTVLFDLLNFGDKIVVKDLGNGTFTVTGSYANVSMIDADTWVIKNVNGTDNGNGTYTIRDTP